ncbi:uncharacterized protein LOC134284508 [Aedes albopictus]|uniref:Reverse transcriptase n=1 Tax=Aedes albopictus TaxID=7160 RepID=A0ABM1XXU9_AEDAL
MDDDAMKQLIAALTGIAQGNTQRRFDVRDVKDLVVQFDPDIPTTPTAEQWIDSIVKAAALYQGNDEWKLQCGILNLNGAAKLWFSGVTVNTWDDFKTALIRDFPTSVDAVGIHQAMINRKKLPQESIKTYFYSHVALGRKGKLPDEALIKYIVLGLGQIRYYYSSEYPAGFTQAAEMVRRTKTSGVPSANIKCYRCNGEGHVAANCSVKNAGKSNANFECYRCNQKGHIAKNCNKSAPKQFSRPMQEIHQPSNFVKTVIIGNSEIDALYDCGSAVTTIKESCAGVLNSIEPCDISLVGFGGNKVQVRGKSAEMIKVDGIEVESDVCIVPNKVQWNSMIIGRDILDREDIRFVKEKGSVRIENRVESQNDERQSGPSPGQRGTQSNVYSIQAYEPIVAEEINVNSVGEEREKIFELIKCYRQCFAKNYREMGTAKGCEMVIELIGPEKPIHTKQYPMEYSREKVVESTVNDLLAANIVRPSSSSYNSPTVLVRKKNGDWRMVVDYRAVNAKTVKDSWPMPVIEDCLNRLVGNRLFTAVDLFRGYHQIPISENSRRFTAFSTPFGHFEFVKMPFGLSNGSAVFQRMIDTVIAPLRSVGIVVYLDDAIFGGRDVNDVLKKFEALLKRLMECGLTINLEKTQFLKTSLDFLGHEVSEGEIRPGKEKIRAISEFPQPVNVRNILMYDPARNLEVHTDACSHGLSGDS